MKVRRLFLAVALAALVGCSGSKAPTSAEGLALIGTPPGPVVAVVNGESITEPMLVLFAKARGLDPAQPQQRQQALDALVENVLLAQDAIRSGLMAKPEVMAEAALVRVQQIAGRAIASKRESLSVDDAQVQALYDQERQRAGDTEWKIQHILFADKAEAEAALQALQAPGADFDALFNSFPSAKQAKALDWSNATQLPKEIVDALHQLKDGELAPIVVQTSFGFHVLRRSESRPFSPPPIESVREGARKQITENALKEYVAGLRAAAEIATGASSP